MAKTQSLERVHFYRYGLEMHAHVLRTWMVVESDAWLETKIGMGVGWLFLSYAVMWTHSRETRPERRIEMKREGDHVLTHVLPLHEKFAGRKWFLFFFRWVVISSPKSKKSISKEMCRC